MIRMGPGHFSSTKFLRSQMTRKRCFFGELYLFFPYGTLQHVGYEEVGMRSTKGETLGT